MRRTQIYLDEELNEAMDPVLAAIGSVTGLPQDAAVSHDRDLYGAPDRT